MYSTFSHSSQETFSTKNVLTGRGPHWGLEHLLTDRAVEVVFGVGRGGGELLSHGAGLAGGGDGDCGGPGPGSLGCSAASSVRGARPGPARPGERKQEREGAGGRVSLSFSRGLPLLG